MSQARVLYDLQQIDTEIRTKKQRLGEVLRLQKEPPELVAARERAKAADDALHQARAQHKDLTLEIAGLTDKAKRSEERLYSGNVKNTKELADLQHEVEALGRRRAALEEEAIRALMTIDERQAAKTAADAEVESLAGQFQTDGAALQKEQRTLALRLNDLLEKRKRQVQMVKPQLLAAYDQLAQQKHGQAVAGLRGDKCLGCQVTVSNRTVRAADEGKLVYCDSCGRMLYPL